MKQILIALLFVFTASSPASAQPQTNAARDSIRKTEINANEKKSVKTDKIDVTAGTAEPDTTVSGSTNKDTSHGQGNTSIGLHADDNDFPFDNLGNSTLLPIITIIAVFGLPVFIIFIIFFFRYKNRQARYRLIEQALATGQPLPEELLRKNKPTDQRSRGIKNTFTGIGLFIFLWAITEEFEIASIGLLVMFMGIGQWLIGYMQHKNEQTPVSQNHTRYGNDKDGSTETRTENRSGIISPDTKAGETNEEKNEENR